MSERKNKAFFSEECCHGREWGECPRGVGVVFQRRVSFPPGSGQRSPHSLISRCMREVRRAQTTNRVHAGKGGGGGVLLKADKMVHIFIGNGSEVAELRRLKDDPPAHSRRRCVPVAAP